VSHSFNANWIAATESGALLPTYFIRIEGIDDKQFSTAPIRGATRDTRVLLEVPDSVGQVIDQLRGKSSLSITKILLVDHADDLTTIFAVQRPGSVINTTVNREIQLFSGYMTLDETDYEEIARGQIATLKLRPDEKTYELRIVDEKRGQDEDVMTNADAGSLQRVATIITGAVSSGEEFVNILDINGVDVEDFFFIGPNLNGDEERVEVRSIVGSRIRLLDPLVFSYEVGSEFRWGTTIIEGNPVNILFSILLGKFDDPAFPLDFVRGLPTGLDIPAARLVSADFIRERDYWHGDEVWRLEFKRETRGLNLLERVFYRFLGYPTIALDGRGSFRMFHPAFAEDAVLGLKKLGKADVLSWKWERAHKLHVNRVEMGVDDDLESNEPGFIEVIEDLQDQADSKETVIIEEEGTGFRTGLRGVRLAQERGEIILARLNPPPDQLRLDVSTTHREIEVGQVVELTHPNIPNRRTGQRGLADERLEVVGRNEAFGKSSVELLLQDANYERPAFIGDDVKDLLFINFTDISESEGFFFYEDYELDDYPQTGFGVNSDITLGWLGTPTMTSFDRDVQADERKDSGVIVTGQFQARRFQIDVPNGVYTLRLIAGDPSNAHGPMTCRANGVTFWSVASLAADEYLDVWKLITVTDGTIVINMSVPSGGTTSVLNAINLSDDYDGYDSATDNQKEYAHIGSDPAAPDLTDFVRLNFQTPSGSGFAGYDSNLNVIYPNFGHGVDGTTVLGFTGSGSVVFFNADNVASPDERYDTGVFTNPGQTRGFRVDVPNGVYIVRVVGGHAFVVMGPAFLKINGATIWSNSIIPLATWNDVTTEVNVTNARIQLELGAVGSGRSPINWVLIQRVDVGGLFDDDGKPYGIT
jgi:hypothetical protein